MQLSIARLREFYSNEKLKPKASLTQKIRRFTNHPLLESCLASLIPYFEMKDLPENIASLKITEAISILRAIDEDIDDVFGKL